MALEQSIDFIKNSIASVEQAELTEAEQQCGKKHDKPIAGLIGPGSSTVTIQVQNLLALFNIPQIGYSATSKDLSDKARYRYFLRVVPSDSLQAQALADLVRHYKWTYISTVYTYGTWAVRCVCVFGCACVCEWERGKVCAWVAGREGVCECVCVRACVRACMRACMRVFATNFIHARIHTQSKMSMHHNADKLFRAICAPLLHTVEPVLGDHPFCPAKTVSQDRWSLIAGRTQIMFYRCVLFLQTARKSLE